MRVLQVRWTDESVITWKDHAVICAGQTEDEVIALARQEWDECRTRYKIDTYDAEFRIVTLEIPDNWFENRNSLPYVVVEALAREEGILDFDYCEAGRPA